MPGFVGVLFTVGFVVGFNSRQLLDQWLFLRFVRLKGFFVLGSNFV